MYAIIIWGPSLLWPEAPSLSAYSEALAALQDLQLHALWLKGIAPSHPSQQQKKLFPRGWCIPTSMPFPLPHAQKSARLILRSHPVQLLVAPKSDSRAVGFWSSSETGDGILTALFQKGGIALQSGRGCIEYG